MNLLKNKIGLLFLIVMIFGVLIALSGCQVQSPAADETKSQKSAKPTAAPAEPQSEAQPTVTAAPTAEKAPEDLQGFTEYTVKEQLGEKSHGGKARARKIAIEGSENDKSVVVDLNANDAFSANMTVRGMLMDSKKLLEPLSERKDVKKVSISEYLDVEDMGGGTVEEWVYTLTLDREGLDKVASGDYLLSDLTKIAAEYKLHPNFKQ